MKKLSFLIILLSLISCQKKTANIETTNVNDPISAYQQGQDLLKPDTAGTVDFVKALELFNKSVSENPDHLESRLWKMHCEFQLGQMENALQTAENVLNDKKFQTTRYMPQFFVTAGFASKVLGNEDKANDYFGNALDIYSSRISISNEDIDAISNKAVVLCYLGKNKEAIKFVNSIKLEGEKQKILDEFKSYIASLDVDKMISSLKGNIKSNTTK
jgi:tetratricopeptide (TPR) repeat protein